VSVSVPGLSAHATVVAAWPRTSREALVDLARRRGRFWTWRDAESDPLEGTAPGRWIVFGCDRVLGQGSSPSAAIADAEGATDLALHRYVLRVGDPIPGRRLVDLDATGPATLRTGGRTIAARATPGDAPEFVVAAGDSAGIALEQAEWPGEVVLERADGGATRAVRAGWVPLDVDPFAVGAARDAFVVVEPAPASGAVGTSDRAAVVR
jgi:hypothetical protein